MTISTQRVFYLEGIICHVKACWGDTWPLGGQKWKWTWQVNRKWNWFYKLFDMSRDMSGINPTMSNFWSDNTVLWLVTSKSHQFWKKFTEDMNGRCRFSNFPKLLSHSCNSAPWYSKIGRSLDSWSQLLTGWKYYFNFQSHKILVYLTGYVIFPNIQYH